MTTNVYINIAAPEEVNSSEITLFGVFGSRRGLQANQGTVGKSAISPQPGNRKRIKWSNTAYLNKRSFMFKIKFCVFQVTTTSFCKKGIRILNAQPVKFPSLRACWRVNKHGDPIFLLHFFNVRIMNVEQFQGNYLKWLMQPWIVKPLIFENTDDSRDAVVLLVYVF